MRRIGATPNTVTTTVVHRTVTLVCRGRMDMGIVLAHVRPARDRLAHVRHRHGPRDPWAVGHAIVHDPHQRKRVAAGKPHEGGGRAAARPGQLAGQEVLRRQGAGRRGHAPAGGLHDELGGDGERAVGPVNLHACKVLSNVVTTSTRIARG